MHKLMEHIAECADRIDDILAETVEDPTLDAEITFQQACLVRYFLVVTAKRILQKLRGN